MQSAQDDGNAHAALTLAAVAAAFFAISLSPDIERITSPHIWGLQVVLRKTYSVLAFAVVAFLLARLRRSTIADVFPVALMLALYSVAIEAAQALLGSREGSYWNVVDVLCGFLGGMLGGMLRALLHVRRL